MTAKCQTERALGKKVVVCLHHKPFAASDSKQLDDADQFWPIIEGKIDCLLYGHESDFVYEHRDSEHQIPLIINCENLEHVADENGDAYPISVLDLGTYRRLVFWTNNL